MSTTHPLILSAMGLCTSSDALVLSGWVRTISKAEATSIFCSPGTRCTLPSNKYTWNWLLVNNSYTKPGLFYHNVTLIHFNRSRLLHFRQFCSTYPFITRFRVGPFRQMVGSFNEQKLPITVDNPEKVLKNSC